MSVITDAMPPPPETTFLSLPGLHGSGAAHWQSHWERSDPRFRRVEQASWSRPELGDWAVALDRAVRASQLWFGPGVAATRPRLRSARVRHATHEQHRKRDEGTSGPLVDGEPYRIRSNCGISASAGTPR